MRKFLFLLIALAAAEMQGQTLYSVSHYLPATSPYYSTNVPNNVSVVFPSIGGAMATNALGSNGVSSALWNPLLTLAAWDTFTLQITWSNGPGTVVTTTNQFYLYPVPDGVNPDTTHPVWSSGLITNSSTNILATNLAASIIGNTGYFQLGGTNSGSNYITNIDGQVFVKKKIQAVSSP